MSTEYDPFSVFPEYLDERRKRKQIDPNDFRFGEIGAAVSDFPQAEMAKRGVNLQAPRVDPVLPEATDYDPFATFRQSRTAVEQPDPSILFPRSRGQASGEPNLGVLGESFGIYSPEDQQNWLKAEKQAAQGMITGAQERLRNRRAMGMSPEDDLLGADEARQATASIKQGQTRLQELAAMERGELALPIKSGLRSAVENFPRSVAETMISIPEMAGIIKGYVQDGPVDDEFLLNWSRGAKDWVARQFPGDPARQDEFAQQLATGAGSLVSFYGVGILARLAKLSQAAQVGIVSAFGGSASGTQGFEEATRELQQARAEAAASGDQPAVDDYDRLLKTLGYSAVGLTEAAPIARTLTRAVPNAQTRLGQRLIQGAEGAAEEAVQESGAQLAQNVISQYTTDPERAAMEGVGESAAVGGVLGGLMNFMMPGRFSPDQGGGQTGGPASPYPQLPPPENWDWLDQGVEDRGPLTPLEDLPIGGEPDPSTPLAIPDLNAPERNALKTEMTRLLNANPALSAQADQFLSAVDQPGPTQNVVQAALQKVRDTGKLSAVANELIQTMRPAMAQTPATQAPQAAPDMEVRDQYAAPGTAGRVQTSPFQEQTPGQTQTLDREPLTLPSVPLSENDILPAIGPGVPSRDIDDLGFYSQALESARTLPQATGTPEQMLAQIEKSGTKEAEIRATDLDKFLFGEAIAQLRRQLIDMRTEANALRSEMGQKDPEITPARRAEIEAELARLQPLLATGEEELRQGLQSANLPRRIARDDLVNYLDQNRVRLQQHQYGDPAGNIEVLPSRNGGFEIVDVTPEYRGGPPQNRFISGPYETESEAREAAAEAARFSGVRSTAKWETYSLDPGNPTYRENVVYLPIPESAPQFDPAKVKIERRRRSGTQASTTISYDGKVLLDGAEDSDQKPDSYWIDYARRVFEEGDRFNRLEPMQEAFRQGHFEEPNVVSHYRTQQLQTADGRTVLNGDEFQSDWGQKIREGGARDEAKIADLTARYSEAAKETASRYDPARQQIADLDNLGFDYIPQAMQEITSNPNWQQAYDVTDAEAAPIQAYVDALNRERILNAELRTATAATPAHPLVRTTDQWLATTLRKFVKDAVDAGVDGVTITPGKVQLERYNIGRVLDHIDVQLFPGGERGLSIFGTGGRMLGTAHVDQNGLVTDAVGFGGDLASQMRNRPLSDTIGVPGQQAVMATTEPEQTIPLDDINVGGEGMRATYDKIYPRALAKILQKYDKSIKPERVRVVPSSYDPAQSRPSNFDEWASGTAFENDFIFFPITDKVRQKVREEGQPLFAIGGGPNVPTYALESNPQAAIDALRIGGEILQDWLGNLARTFPEGAWPGPDAALAAVSAITQSGQRTMEALRRAMVDAGFQEPIPDEILSQGLLAANFLMAPETKEGIDPLFAIASLPLSGNAGRMTVLQRQQSDIFNQIDTLTGEIKDLIGGKGNDLTPQEEAAYNALAAQVDALNERLPEIEQELNDLYDKQHDARAQSGLFEKRSALMDQARNARYEKSALETEVDNLTRFASVNDFQTRRQLQIAQQRLADATEREAEAQAELDKIEDDLSNLVFALRGFYSPAIRAVEKAKQDKATPEQWKKVLTGPGVKQEEVRWLGVMDWLDEQASMMVDRPGSNQPKSEKTIAKSDLIDFMRAHQYEIEQRILLSERDPDDIPEDERVDEDDEPADVMTEEERDEWIRGRAQEIQDELEREAISEQVGEWERRNDPDDYDVEIQFEDFTGALSDAEQELLEAERVYTEELNNYNEAMLQYAQRGEVYGQIPLPGMARPRPVEPNFDEIAERILSEDTQDNWREGYIGWVADLEHPYDREDEEIQNGDVFPTRQAAQEAANARLEAIREAYDEEFEAARQDIYNQDFAYEYDQAHQQARQDFEDEYGDSVRQSGDYFPDQTRYKQYRIKGGRHYQEMLVRLPMLEGKYSSHHYQDQEVVHIRYDVREGPNGERVLFIHEIQSDLHQRARAFGFGAQGLERAKKVHDENGWTPELTQAQNAADLRLSKIREEFFNLESQNLPQNHALVQTALNEVRDAEAKASEITKRAQANREAASTYISTFSRFGGAPEAPYTGTAWWELGFKAALQRAVEKGFDGVALTTPAQIREATYTPEKVAQKFYGENVPKFINKYVKQWGSKPEQKPLSGIMERKSVARLRDNYTVNDFVNWLNAWKNQIRFRRQTTTEVYEQMAWDTIDRTLNAVTSPSFDGDIKRLVESDPELRSKSYDTIPPYWRTANGQYSNQATSQRETLANERQESPLVPVSIQVENPYWPITDAMRKDLSGEGTGQPLAIGQEQILRGVNALLSTGRAVTIGENVKDAIFTNIEPFRDIVPQNVAVSHLSRIEPIKGTNRVNAYFTAEDGTSYIKEIDREFLLRLRAFYQPSGSNVPEGIVFVRYGASGDLGPSLRGELGHEAIHALRRNDLIPDAVWSRLLSHANKLRVLEISLGDYLATIGYNLQGNFNKVLGAEYDDVYSGRTDYNEVMGQEAVAHMTELYIHDAWTEEEIAPVKAILDDIIAGRYSGISPDPRGGSQIPSFALSPVNRQGQPIKNDPKFKRWFKQSAVQEDGDPKIVYHATLADIPAFDPRRPSIESNLGKGFYFTDSTEDSSANYGRVIGPDIKSRITNLAEQINSDAGLEYNDPHGFDKAREQLGYVHEGVNMPVYLSMQKPIVLSDPFSGIESTFFPYEDGEIYDPETDDYEQGEPSGELVEFFENLRQVAPDYDNVNIEPFIADLMDDVFINGGLTADQIYTLASHSENIIYGEDPATGSLSGMEPIRRAYEMMGYDGIIDHTVDEKFSTMPGIQGATHYVVFKPEQIKSVFNAGGFDPDDPNILAAIGGEKKGTRSQLAKDMLLLVRNGAAAPVPVESAKPVFDAIRPAQDMVPSEYFIANISGIYPDQEETNQAKPKKILFDFKTEDGQRYTLRLPPHYMQSSAFHAVLPEMQNRPSASGIFFVNLTPDGGSAQYFRGVIRHEAVHALRTKNRIPEAIWLRLLDHAEKLRVMDHSLGSYLEATGITDITPKDYEVSIYDSYHDLYKANTRFYQEFIDQEQIAHMVELYEHGVFTPQEIAPVKHILDAMFRGDFSRDTPEQAQAVSIPEPDYQVPQTIANQLRKIANETQPARSDSGQPSAAEAGFGASQRLSPADRITPTREDFDRSSLIGESLGRRPIDEPLRHEAVRAYLGNWWKQNATLKRAKLQGFTLPAWHATRSDFLVPNPNVPSRDFGFHVAINTPNAANERAGFSEKEIEEQTKWQAVVPEAISNMIGFWSDRRRTRNLPLLVKVRNPLRVPDLNAWGSLPMWRGFITDLFAGRVHDIDYMKTHKIFKEIYAMTESVMQEKALGDPNFDADQTFRQLLINILENYGYDSLIYKNDYEDKGNDSLFLWDAARVRSAFDTFDPRANGNPGLYASVPFMEADMRQELNQALREEGLEGIMAQFALGSAGGGVVDTPEFRRWFGDSKVVDANGEPLVVYHGTTYGDIESFMPEGGGERSQEVLDWFRKNIKENRRFGYMSFRSGTFFSPDPEYAGNYTRENTGLMYPVYIKAENPLYKDQVTGEVTPPPNSDQVPDALILHINGKINEISVIDPTQVKSAIGNRGTFDPNDPRIAFSLGGSIEGSPETNQRPITELYTDYLKTRQKSGKKPMSFKEFANQDGRITL